MPKFFEASRWRCLPKTNFFNSFLLVDVGLSVRDLVSDGTNCTIKLLIKFLNIPETTDSEVLVVYRCGGRLKCIHFFDFFSLLTSNNQFFMSSRVELALKQPLIVVPSIPKTTVAKIWLYPLMSSTDIFNGYKKCRISELQRKLIFRKFSYQLLLLKLVFGLHLLPLKDLSNGYF